MRQLTIRAGRSLKLRALDLRDRLTGRADPLVPPRRLVFVGEGDYREVGEEFLGYLVELAGLKPDDRVLDIGCGVGRIARPLTGFLSEEGSYEGFDPVPEGVEWCRRQITPRFPNFGFRHVDIANAKYNPQGAVAPDRFRFPYPDGSFDLAVATSVFTHMLAPEHRNYLAETARVLKPGGRLLATYFLLDTDSEAGAAAPGRQAAFDFSIEADGAVAADSDLPAEAVAYREPEIHGLYGSLGLELQRPIRYGSWSGRAKFLSFQDIVVARKAAGN